MELDYFLSPRFEADYHKEKHLPPETFQSKVRILYLHKPDRARFRNYFVYIYCSQRTLINSKTKTDQSQRPCFPRAENKSLHLGGLIREGARL